MANLDVVKEIRELKTQLAYSKKIGFFFGAGTSCALNIPNIDKLTEEVEKALVGDLQKHFRIVKEDLKTSIKSANIEDILNQVRRIRELTTDDKGKSYLMSMLSLFDVLISKLFDGVPATDSHLL